MMSRPNDLVPTVKVLKSSKGKRQEKVGNVSRSPPSSNRGLRKKHLHTLKKEMHNQEREHSSVIRSIKEKFRPSQSSKALGKIVDKIELNSSLEQQLQKNKDFYEKEIKNLQEYVINLKQKMRTEENNNYFEKYQKEKEKLRDTVRAKNECIEEIQIILTEKERKLEKTEIQVNVLYTEIKTLKEKLQNTDLQTMFEKCMKDLETKLSPYESFVNKLCERIGKIENKKFIHEQEKNALKNLMRQMENSLKNKEKKINELRKANSDLRNKMLLSVEEADKDKFHTQYEIESLQTKLSRSNHSLALVQREFEKLSYQNSLDRDLIVELNQKIEKLNHTYSGAKSDDIQELRENLNSFSKENTKLKEKYEDIDKEIKNISEELAFNKELLKEKDEYLERANTEISDKIEKLKDYQGIIKNNTDLLDRLHSENAYLNQQLIEVSKTGQARDTENELVIEKLSSEIDELKNQLISTVTSLKLNETESKISNHAISKQLQVRKEKSKDLKHQNLALTEQISSLQNDKSKLETDLLDKENLIKNLKTELENAKASSKATEDILNTLRLEYASISSKNQELEELSVNLNQYFVSYTQETENLQLELSILNAEKEVMLTELEKYKEKNMAYDTHIETQLLAIEEENDQLKLDMKHIKLDRDESLRKLQEELENRRDIYKTHLESLDTQIMKLESSNNLLQKEIESLKEELEQTKTKKTNRQKEDDLMITIGQQHNRIYELEMELGQTKANMYYEFEKKDDTIQMLKGEIKRKTDT